MTWQTFVSRGAEDRRFLIEDLRSGDPQHASFLIRATG